MLLVTFRGSIWLWQVTNLINKHCIYDKRCQRMLAYTYMHSPQLGTVAICNTCTCVLMSMTEKVNEVFHCAIGLLSL